MGTDDVLLIIVSILTAVVSGVLGGCFTAHYTLTLQRRRKKEVLLEAVFVELIENTTEIKDSYEELLKENKERVRLSVVCSSNALDELFREFPELYKEINSRTYDALFVLRHVLPFIREASLQPTEIKRDFAKHVLSKTIEASHRILEYFKDSYPALWEKYEERITENKLLDIRLEA